MARKCLICAREIPTGILCEKCDKPRKKSAPEPESQLAIGEDTASRAAGRSSSAFTEYAHALDPFPMAPVVPFPVEASSPAITSIADILKAAGVASILLGPDKSVKFVSDEAKALFDGSQADFASVRFVEEKTGLRLGDLSTPVRTEMRIRERNLVYSLVPMSGGASGAVLVFRPTMLPGFEVPAKQAGPIPAVSDVVRRVAERFVPYADAKGIHLQIDVQDIAEQFVDHDLLAESLAILMDNALHYVPIEGQVIIGSRFMEHKQKPLLLFFVMDNGPIIPESLRQVIFEPSFVWNPSAPERTGRGLFKCREFAMSHAGSVWVESRSGKACTFFLRVRPDGVR